MKDFDVTRRLTPEVREPNTCLQGQSDHNSDFQTAMTSVVVEEQSRSRDQEGAFMPMFMYTVLISV